MEEKELEQDGIFKIKKDGVYRARLVAKDYNQQAGVDFDYNYAPVLNEVTFIREHVDNGKIRISLYDRKTTLRIL